MVSLKQLRQLQSPTGMRALAEIRDLAPAPATSIAIAARLRKTYPADLVIAAMAMHDLRVKAESKFSRAREMWFTREGLEQATSELIAKWRAERFTGQPAIVDLCCGIGGDLLGLATSHQDATISAVDRDPVHLAIARLNAEIFEVAQRIAFVEADVRLVKLDADSGVFIDPARRTDRGRMASGLSEPPMDWCIGLGEGDRAAGIKAAPGLDYDLVPDAWEFEAIALGADLKEAVLWSPPIARVTRSATIITHETTHHFEPVAGGPVANREPAPGDTLLDPNPAITRSGLVEDLARSIGASKIDDQIGFLVADRPVKSPFARSLTIVASEPWNERALKSRLRELDAGPIDIRRRGLAGDVDAITKRLRGKGDRRFTIAMTRVMDKPWAIVCED